MSWHHAVVHAAVALAAEVGRPVASEADILATLVDAAGAPRSGTAVAGEQMH
jgi:arylsulfatase A-like enzyme